MATKRKDTEVLLSGEIKEGEPLRLDQGSPQVSLEVKIFKSGRSDAWAAREAKKFRAFADLSGIVISVFIE